MTDIDPTRDLRPEVNGVECKNGHFNDPDVRYCQVCGISMAQLTLITRRGRRPSLGVLLFDDSSTYRLESDYVIGRDPAPADARPIKLTFDVGGVSRQHVRVSLVDWKVYVTDLGSANGTTVDDVPLEPGRPAEVRPGAVVKLVNRWFRYESHRS